MNRQVKVAVVGLGYVGLPVAVAFGARFPGTVGFDVGKKKVTELNSGNDSNGEVSAEELAQAALVISDDPEVLRGANFFIVAVPTPVDKSNRPDLSPLRSACALIGPRLTPGAIVVFESTVYPGVTEDFCGPLLEAASGLKAGSGFKLGYSPERINPGDTEHVFSKITKVVSAQDEASLEVVARMYGSVVEAGVFRASSIKVAEAAKVIENTQRDLNIALMNELAIIFDRIGIRTADVLAAARTKWNFLPFSPGLVGGHCIGVDPYYLTHKSEELGYIPQVILSGRRINDGMGAFVAQRVIKSISKRPWRGGPSRVVVLGLAFKENVSDLRNSRVPDIVRELREFGADVMVHDPVVDAAAAVHEYGLRLADWEELRDADALILAVPHREYLGLGRDLFRPLRSDGYVFDVKSVLPSTTVPPGVAYESL